MNEDQQAISQKVEQNVRMLIGDLYMQVLVLRATIEANNDHAKMNDQAKVNGRGEFDAHEKRQTT